MLKILVLMVLALWPLQSARSASGTLTPAAADNTGGATSGDKLPSKQIPKNWSAGLRSGPNGPIPLIVVDQFGYPPLARKVAVIRRPQIGFDRADPLMPGPLYALVEASSGTIVKQAKPVAWGNGRIDSNSGDQAWWFDFSEIQTPGRYIVMDLERGIRSAEFTIARDVYKDVLKHAVRMFYYQRAGIEKASRYAGAEWADAASHLGAGQDAEAQAWPPSLAAAGPSDPSVRDLRGGWYDAGDYNKYTSWTARNIIVLLRAYEENPRAFLDDTGIPESGNGVPDLLDEVKWGMDWLTRMQGSDGALLCVQSLASGSPPSSASGPSYYGPATTSASLMGAAAFAYGAHIFAAQSDPQLRAYAADLAKRSRRAWEWANAHPNAAYYNNDENKQPGSEGLAAGQQEMSEAGRLLAKVEAAIYLYQLDGEPTFRAFVENNYRSIVPDWGPTQWDTDGQEALLSYTGLTGITETVKQDILNRFFAGMKQHLPPSDPWQGDPYRSPIKDYTWGSNKSKAAQARLYQLAGRYSHDGATTARMDDLAIEYCHYIHGVNPLGLVYLTNMATAGAEHSASTLYHAWFASGTRWDSTRKGKPGPPPGFLVGGPNPTYVPDACCSAPDRAGEPICGSTAAAAMCRRSFVPPTGQPPLKAYLQFNDGWPANSWQITEPSTSYQAYYIRLLAAFQ